MENSTSNAPAAGRQTHPWVAAGRDTIRFGVAQVTALVDWSAYLRFVWAAEDLGFDPYLGL
jgi:hypothetical protein